MIGEDQQQGDRPLDPEKLLRIASLTRAVLDEVRQMDPDGRTAGELAALHQRVTTQLHEALPNVLVEELEAIDLDLRFEDGPTGQGVRLAYAGLIGWLAGLFQGLQAAMQMQHAQALLTGGQQKREGEIEKGKDEETPMPGRYL